MNKKKHGSIEVAELDLRPISDEDIALVSASQETTNMNCGGGDPGGGGGDSDSCDSWWCFWYTED